MPGVSGSEKAPGALLTIGEVSAETGVAAHVLRYWEEHVPALKPLRRAGGRRYYRADDVALVRRLQSLVRDQGYTLDGAAKAIRRRETPADDAAVAAPAPAPVVPAEPVAPSAPYQASFAFTDNRAQLIKVRALLKGALEAS